MYDFRRIEKYETGQVNNAQYEQMVQIAKDFTEWLKDEENKLDTDPEEVQEIIHELIN